MASAPGFDPNLFVNGIGHADFRTYNEDEKKPLFHKCVTGVYPPGSTFKMIVGIAAKQAGVADDWAVSCPGSWYYGGRTWHCWRPGGHGRVSLHDAIKHSCDVYFYQAALQAGPERIAAAARQFGLGERFDVSVPNVRDGLIPDPTWWRANRNEGWTGGLTVNYGIGQGAMGITPLQLAVMAARLGNNGLAVVPRLVREAPGVADPPQPPRMAGIESEFLARVRDGMYGVCNEPGGTAVSAGRVELVRHPETGAAVPITPTTAVGSLCRSPAKPAPRKCAHSAATVAATTRPLSGSIATMHSSVASARGTNRVTLAPWSSNTVAPVRQSPARSRARS